MGKIKMMLNIKCEIIMFRVPVLNDNLSPALLNHAENLLLNSLYVEELYIFKIVPEKSLKSLKL